MAEVSKTMSFSSDEGEDLARLSALDLVIPVIIGHNPEDTVDSRRSTFAFKGSIDDATPEEVLQSWDGSSPASSNTVEALIRNWSKAHMNEKATNKRFKLVLRVLAVCALVMTGMVVAMFFVVEGSKETHIQHGVMTDLEGKPVKVGSVESIGSLFELPMFDLPTLIKVREIAVKYKDGRQAFFQVTGAEKNLGSMSVRLFTGQGEISIDGHSQMAVVTTHGKSHLIETSPMSRRLLAAGAPRLYSASEFFTKSNGFVSDGSRRLERTARLEGFASFALDAGEAVLEALSEGHGRDYKNVLLTGTAYEKTPMSSQGSFELFITADDEEPNILKLSSAEGVMIASSSAGFSGEFIFDSGKQLIECSALTQGSGTEMASALKSIDIKMHDDKGNSILTVSNDKFVLDVKDASFDLADVPIQQPDPNECVKLNRKKVVTERNSTALRGSGRRLGVGSKSADECLAAYWLGYAEGNYGGWMLVGGSVVRNGNAAAGVFMSGNKYLVAFRGTDAWSFEDWAANLKTGVTGHHTGFQSYAASLLGGIKGKLGSNKLSYAIGHSMGGAAAEVFYMDNKEELFDTNAEVITVGHPAGSVQSDCGMPGRRYFQPNDPIASSFDFAWWIRDMSRFQHQQNGGSFEVASADPCYRTWEWSRRRRCRKTTFSEKSCAHKTSGFNVVSAAWHFVTTHTDYDNVCQSR